LAASATASLESGAIVALLSEAGEVCALRKARALDMCAPPFRRQ